METTLQTWTASVHAWSATTSVASVLLCYPGCRQTLWRLQSGCASCSGRWCMRLAPLHCKLTNRVNGLAATGPQPQQALKIKHGTPSKLLPGCNPPHTAGSSQPSSRSAKQCCSQSRCAGAAVTHRAICQVLEWDAQGATCHDTLAQWRSSACHASAVSRGTAKVALL